MHKLRNLIILISPQPYFVLILFLIMLLKTNLSSHLVRSQKSSRSTRTNSDQFRVNFNLPDELPANHFIGNIPSQLPAFPFGTETDLSVSTTLVDKSNFGSRLLRTSDSGDLYTLAAMDRDNRDQICGPLNCCQLMVCNFTVEVLFVHPKWDDVSVHVTLQMHDSNDNFPHFSQPTYSLWIAEDNGLTLQGGQHVTRPLYELPAAYDLDADPNGIVQYRLTGHPIAVSTFQLFSNLSRGQLSLGIRPGVTLDYETLDERIIKLTIQAIDGGQPAHTTQMLLVIHITDLNDNRPVFDKPIDTIHVAENTVPDRSIYTVHATDADSDDNALIRYSFNLGNPNLPAALLEYFSFHPTTGKLRLRKALDYEQYAQRHIELRFTAKDAGSPPLSSNMKLIITITDVNDNPPQLLVQTNRTILEHSAPGQLALRLTVRDLDEISRNTVRCEGDPGQSVPLRLESSPDNTILSIFTTTSVDHERYPTLHYSITCTDSAEPRQIVQFNLTAVVQDINDNAPVFRFPSHITSQGQYNITVSEGEPVNKLILIVTADDADSSEFGKVTYSLFDVKIPLGMSKLSRPNAPGVSYKAFFKIDPETGSIFLTKRLDYELTDLMIFGVMAKDGPVGQENVRKTSTALVVVHILDINDNPPLLDSPHQIDVVEHVPIGTNLGIVRFSDPDSGSAGKVTVRGILPNLDTHRNISSSEPITSPVQNKEHFKLTEDQHLVTIHSIDREQTPWFTIRILAVDNGDPIQLATTATVTINVIDINDNNPIILSPKPNSTVTHTPIKVDDVNKLLLNKIESHNLISKGATSSEKLIDLVQLDSENADHILYTHVSGTILYQIRGEDADSGDNARISYTLFSECNGSKYFHVESDTGYIRSRLRRLSQAKSTQYLTVDDIAWIPQTGNYLFCVRLTDHGKPPLSSNSNFWFNVTQPISKAMVNAMWPADSAEYGTIGFANTNWLAHSASKSHNLTRLMDMNHTWHRANSSVSNIVISLLVAIFAVTLFCALTASILWAHSKHRRRRNRARRNRAMGTFAGIRESTTQDDVLKRDSVQIDRADDSLSRERFSDSYAKSSLQYLNGVPDARVVRNPSPRFSSPDPYQCDRGKREGESRSPICITHSPTALCDLIPVTENLFHREHNPLTLVTSSSTIPNPVISDVCTVHLIPNCESGSLTRKDKALQQTLISSTVTPMLDVIESPTAPLLDSTPSSSTPYPKVGTLSQPCPKHGPHYLLHSENPSFDPYTISLPTPVYTVNQVIEGMNTSGSLGSNVQRSGEYPLGLDTIYPNPSNTTTMLTKTISWVPLPLISESLSTPMTAGFIYIDPLKPMEPENSAPESNSNT